MHASGLLPVRVWRWIFPIEHLTIATELSPDALLDAIRSRLPQRSWLRRLGFRSQPQVVGAISAGRVRLRYIGGMVHSSSDPVFVGRVVPSADGAWLDGTFQAPLVVQAFFFFWSGFIVLWMVLALAFTIGNPRAYLALPVVVLFPIGMLTFGVTINRWGAARRRRAMEAMASLLMEAANSHVGQRGNAAASDHEG